MTFQCFATEPCAQSPHLMNCQCQSGVSRRRQGANSTRPVERAIALLQQSLCSVIQIANLTRGAAENNGCSRGLKSQEQVFGVGRQSLKAAVQLRGREGPSKSPAWLVQWPSDTDPGSNSTRSNERTTWASKP